MWPAESARGSQPTARGGPRGRLTRQGRFALFLLAALAVPASGIPRAAIAQGLAVPCEDPALAIAARDLKTCACEEVPQGECAYEAGHDACLQDPLVCRAAACEGLTERHPINVRCSRVGVDQTEIPNIVLVVSDDMAWPFYEDLHNEATGESYSLWREYYRNLVCHGGDEPGEPCVRDPNCAGGGVCRAWSRRCVAGLRSGTPCQTEADCGGGGATCEPCPAGECSSNPMRTPQLARLAESGAFFPVAHTTAAVCAPSIMSMLTGQFGKDYQPQRLPVLNATMPRLLNETHCSVSVGKTWRRKYDQTENCIDCCCVQEGCCSDPDACSPSCSKTTCCGDPRTGFHYSVDQEYRVSFKQIGRLKHSLEKGACLVREINQEGRAFFTWLLPYVPHNPRGAPPAFKACYEGVGHKRRMRVNGSLDRLPGRGFLGRISWFDCILGTYLNFLETTPDTRFCPHPDGHTPEAHGCGPCTRECSDTNPCGDGVECVDGRCDTDIPCLVDTTLILYVNDNGKGIRRSKLRFSENGYRNPVILSHRGLGSFDGAALSSLPAPIEARLHADRMVQSLDFLPTVLKFANCPNGRCSDLPRVSPPELRTRRHRGQNLKSVVEGGSLEVGRARIFGHNQTKNHNVFGRDGHYVRTPKFVAMGVPATGGAGSCNRDQDCADQQWDNPAPELHLGLDRCVNGVCTKSCDSRDDCRVLGPEPSVECINGVCATGNACKLYHFPGGCRRELYNLANDPDEGVNLLAGETDHDSADPLRACYDEDPATPGGRLFDQLSCELARWCLEDCRAGHKLDCSDCCLAENCGECEIADCAQCLLSGACVQVAESVCLDCRRSCSAGDSDCADLGVVCSAPAGKCSPFPRRGVPVP